MDANRDFSIMFGCVRNKFLPKKSSRNKVHNNDHQQLDDDAYLHEVTSSSWSPAITSVNSTTNFFSSDVNESRRTKLKRNTLDKRLRNLQQSFSTDSENTNSNLLSSTINENDRAPIDQYNLVYFSLILSGLGFLLPYNSFVIGAVDYFQDHFPNTTIIFDLSTIYIIIQFIAVCINNTLISLISFKVRIGFGYVLSISTLLVISIFEIGYDLFIDNRGYQMNLFAIAIVSFGCTVQQASFYGFSSMLPKEYTQAVMIGESTSGLIVSISRILTKLLIQDEQLNTLIFFLISTCILVICFFLNYFIKDDEFVKYHVNNCRRDQNSNETYISTTSLNTTSLPTNSMQEQNNIELVVKFNQNNATTDPPVPKSDSTEFDNLPFGIDEEELIFYVQQPNDSEIKMTTNYIKRSSSQTELETNLINQSDVQRHQSNLDNLVENNLHSTISGQGMRRDDDQEQKIVRFLSNFFLFIIYFKQYLKSGIEERLKIVYIIYPLMISICITYLLTLALFPGVVSEKRSSSLKSWTPIILFSIFNVTDVIDKYLTKHLFSMSNNRIVLYSSLRFLLLPCFILCLVPIDEPAFSSIIFILFFTSILGITNGIFGSLPMILAPNFVANKELTGNLMTFSYCVGLIAGTFISYIIENIFLV